MIPTYQDLADILAEIDLEFDFATPLTSSNICLADYESLNYHFKKAHDYLEALHSRPIEKNTIDALIVMAESVMNRMEAHSCHL